MKRIIARWLTGLYPRAWRRRYGAEFVALLVETKRGGIRTWGNVIFSAFVERISPAVGGNMSKHSASSFGVTLRRPIAFLPMAMSLAGLTLVLVHIAMYGAVREADEGTTAHLWQLLMAGQLPMLLFFAVKWLPRAPRPTLYVMALQACAAVAAMVPVFLFKL